MKKITLRNTLFLFLISFFYSISLGYSQTSLSAGDIAITGFNADNPDQFSFVLLTDITSGTEINFTDRGWITATSQFYSGEDTITWTATSDMVCGTEIIVTDSSPFVSSVGTVTDNANFALSIEGDQILAYQGFDFAPTFIYVINFDSTGWSDAIDARTTALPPGLTDAVNAVNLGETDNGNYNCTVSDDAAAILAGVSGSGNWVTSNNRIDILGGCDFFCSSDFVDWCNLQWPDVGNIPLGNTFDVFAQVYEPGVTEAIGQGAGISAWIGFSQVDATITTDFSSSDWTWVQAIYNLDDGNNDEYIADIGPSIPYQGTYYFVSRFQLNDGPYRYGGYSPAPGGGYWDGVNYLSNIVTVGCPSITRWTGAGWDSGFPNSGTLVEINAPYDTSTDAPGSFDACSLIVNDELFIRGTNSVNISGDITINNNGSVRLTTDASLVQENDNANVFLNGNGFGEVTKESAHINNWYEYTYWSSPFSDETVGDGLAESGPNRRFWFEANNFVDSTFEVNNDNSANVGQDDIDDNGDDWQFANATDLMIPGVGYAATLNPLGFFVPARYAYIFEGTFNNGIISVPVERNDTETADTNWNFIGNPYPSSIDVDLFFAQNNYNAVTNPVGTLGGAIYIWSQSSPPSGTNNGNDAQNFSTADYAIINGIEELPGGDNNNDGTIDIDDTPNRFIPSGQGFFVDFTDSSTASSGNVIFNNSMRVTGNNSQFFRGYSVQNINKLKVSLTSNNGISNMISICYVSGATNEYDGMFYDSPRNLSSGSAAILYSTIEGHPRKFAIQGKALESLNKEEVIPIGMKNTIEVDTQFSLSVAQLEGEFMNNNTIFLIDKLLDVEHNLSRSAYPFTSEVGEFNDRFELRFSSRSELIDIEKEDLLLVHSNEENELEFSTTNQSEINNIKIFDLLGRLVVDFDFNNQIKVVIDGNSFNNGVYITKVSLLNGKVLTKKILK